MLCNGASNVEPFTSIYIFVVPCVLGPKLLLEDLGKYSELHNVVVFLMIFIWVHHDIHLDSSCMNEHMNFWAHHMRFI